MFLRLVKLVEIGNGREQNGAATHCYEIQTK